MEVERTKGCRGDVRVPYEIVESEYCKMGKHFTISGKPEIIFKDKQYNGKICIDLHPLEVAAPENMNLKLVLKAPELLSEASEHEQAKPEIIEDLHVCTVTLAPSMATQDFESLKEKAETSWSQKIKDSLTLPQEPNLLEYILYFLQMPFTLAFCLVPPPGLLGGWLAFVIAIAFIGFMTAIIGWSPPILDIPH